MGLGGLPLKQACVVLGERTFDPNSMHFDKVGDKVPGNVV